jgi:hypothetical protein
MFQAMRATAKPEFVVTLRAARLLVIAGTHERQDPSHW